MEGLPHECPAQGERQEALPQTELPPGERQKALPQTELPQGERQDGRYYVLVATSTAAFALYKKLKASGCGVRVAPAPRVEQACCGTAVMLEPGSLAAVEQALREQPCEGFERIVFAPTVPNARRDKFC
jgi:hypothetical protein